MIGEIEYYSPPRRNYRNQVEIGQMFWAPVPYLLWRNLPWLRLEYQDKENAKNSSYTIEYADAQTFEPREHQPIRELNLSSAEFVLCIAHKIRPVIVISPCSPISPLKNEHIYLIAPVYGVRDTSGNYKYSEEFLLRTQAYQYPTSFYLPQEDEFGIEESIVRFDKIIPAHLSILRPRPVRLSKDAVYCLQMWLHYFLGADLDEMISIYREAALKQIKKS